MKTLKIVLAGIIVMAGITTSNQTFAQPGFRANVSFSTFHAELSPYGRWVNMPRYGQVWIYRDPNFRPYYSNGHWMDTDLGWAWESGYPWGWAPFHYGRWEFDPMYGWFWIPGYEYAPAWVVWSQADDYYGWAPLGFGVDINISIGRIPANRWMYAQSRYIGHRRIDRYCIPYQRNSYYYQRQQPVVNVNVYNKVTYRSGPANRNYRSERNDNRQNVNGARPQRINPASESRGSRPLRNMEPATAPRVYSVPAERQNRDNPAVNNNRRFNPSGSTSAPVNRSRPVTENRPVQKNFDVRENKDQFRNRQQNGNSGRRLENAGQRQRIYKAETNR